MTEPHLSADVARGGYDRREQRRGIVHLGIGAFHRAHQATFTDAAMAAGDRNWMIAGVSLRSPQVSVQLSPQNNLFTVTERDTAGEKVRLIGSVAEVLVASAAPDVVAGALTSPDTRLVTLTVTEKGYARLPDGTLDPAVTSGGNTIYHHLARAVVDRHDAGLAPLTLVSCDNLPNNGQVLCDAMIAHLDRVAPAHRRWFETEWACPSTMVDRIVPAPTPGDLDRVAAAIGLRDEGAVITEPFAQWVIEDRFAGPRPRWDVAGAQWVADVRPFETAKLRMLNGAHSALAYLGLERGHDFVHQAVADAAIRPVVEQLMRVEAASSIAPAAGQDLDRYADLLLDRFANAALPHRLAQIATDGTQKIGPRWLEPIKRNRADGRESNATLTALAAWVCHVRGDRSVVSDPLAAQLAALWAAEGTGGIVDALFACHGLFGSGLALQPSDRERLRQLIDARQSSLLPGHG